MPLVLITPSCNQCDPHWQPRIPENYHHASFTFISLSTGSYLLRDNPRSPYNLNQLRIWNVETGRTIETSHGGLHDDATIYCVLDSIPNDMGKVTNTYGIQLADLPYREYQITLHIYNPECGEPGFHSEALLDGERASAGGAELIYDWKINSMWKKLNLSPICLQLKRSGATNFLIKRAPRSIIKKIT